jgi:hypothetical protein
MYDKRRDKNYTVHTVDNDFKTLALETDDRKEVLNWFNGAKAKKVNKQPKTIAKDADLKQAMKEISKEIEDIINK